MAVESTAEKNRVIAEFLGKTVYPSRENINKIWKGGKRWKGQLCDYNEHDLKYHEDWNMLMSVVERIESLGGYVNICTGMVGISLDDIGWGDEVYNYDSKLSATYEACYQFIKQFKEKEG